MTDGNKRRRERETKWGGNHFSSNHVALITPHKPTNCFCPFPLSAGLLNLPLDPISCSFCLLPFSKRQCASALKGWSSISYRLWSNCGKNTIKAFKRNGPNVEHPGAWRTSWLVTWPRPKRTWDPAELTATFTPSRLFGPVLWPDSVLKKIQAERSRKQEMRAESKRPQCIPSYPQCLAASWANTFSITADPSGNETSNPGSIGAALLSIDRQQRTSRGATQPVDAARLFVHFIPTTSATFHFFFFFPLLFAAPASALLRPHMFNTHAHAHRHVLVGADASLQALHWVSERSKGHYKLQVVSLPLSTAIRTVALSLSAKNYTIDLFVRVCTCVNVCVCEKDGRGSACVCLCAWTLS